ncbi:MAG: UDP-2,3-diacylglucosamine diphosphatase [Calditrichaeota bacterium]|nr:UDP-2,3-diacylglucosamine diphosphatase [Calditrichota bacterium]
MGTYYFISDIHVGAAFDQRLGRRYERLISFFNSIKKEGNELFIVGDLFDFWFEYKHAVPAQFYFILFEISKLIEAGVRVHFQPGNHDCWHRDFMSRELHMQIHGEIYTPTLFGKKFYLFHGDGVLKKDKGYRLLKKVVRHPLNIFLYRWTHPDIGIPFAKFMSRSSREYTTNKFFDYTDEYIQFAKDKFDAGFDVVILGHSHNPLMEKINGSVFINLGDWIHHFSYAQFDEQNEIQLKFWNS